MEIRLVSRDFRKHDAEVLACFLTEGLSTDKYEASLIKGKDFKGKQDEILLLYDVKDVKAKRLLFVGLGKQNEITLEKLRRACFLAVDKVKSLNLTSLSLKVPEIKKFSLEEISRALADGAILGDYTFDKYITMQEQKKPKLKNITLLYETKLKDSVKSAVNEEKAVCENSNFVRDLVNENSLDKIPAKFAELIKKVARKNRVKCKILDEKDMKRLGMNLILGVNRGSKYPPRLVILEYYGNPKSKDKTAIIGKGITFDAGGLNIKTTGYIETMKQDMAGAATVVGTLITAAKLKLKKNLIGAMALTENMPGEGAQKPGDVVKSYSGITVEVANTDAEGRLILGDTIGYVVKNYKPNVIIDLATLTGAVVVALGDASAGVIGNDNQLMKKISEAGEKTYERVWQLPIYDEHREDVKSEIADVKNMGFSTRIGYAGPIAGAAFIEKFVGDAKWAHLDIAGTAFMERQRYYLKKGATGFGVRLLAEFLKAS